MYTHARALTERRRVSTSASVSRCHRGEKVKEWDRLAEGPKREHVATAAERERWSNTYHLKQTTAGGASTVATAKHLAVQKAQEWHAVDAETILPRNGHMPTGHGKIGTLGTVGTVQAHRQQDGKERVVFFKSSERKTRPLTQKETRNVMWLWETESVMLNDYLTILAVGVETQLAARMYLQRFN